MNKVTVVYRRTMEDWYWQQAQAKRRWALHCYQLLQKPLSPWENAEQIRENYKHWASQAIEALTYIRGIRQNRVKVFGNKLPK